MYTGQTPEGITTMKHLTESEVRDAQREAADHESKAADLRERAEKRQAEMREAGTDPLRNAEAFNELDELWKDADTESETAKALKDRAARAMEQIGKRTAPAGERRDPEPHTRGTEARARLRMGERVTASEQYAEMRELASRDLAVAARAFGTFDMATRDEFRGMLTRDVSIPKETLIPDDRVGLVNEHPYRGVRALDLISIGETDTDTIDTVVETTPSENVNEAPYNEENGVEFDGSNLLTESSYGFEEKTYSVKRVGHYVPASEGQINDAAQFRSLIDPRMTNGVRRKLELLVVKGDSSTDAWDGIYNTAGIGDYTRDTANSESRHDAVHRAITVVRVANESAPGEEAEPTVIGIHPEDWETVVLEKDADGNYLNGRGMSLPGTIWGLQPVISTVFEKGQPLIGDYAVGAMLWMREGVSLTTTDSHKDWFLRGWIAMKAQTRAAFAVNVPRAFSTVSSF